MFHGGPRWKRNSRTLDAYLPRVMSLRLKRLPALPASIVIHHFEEVKQPASFTTVKEGEEHSPVKGQSPSSPAESHIFFRHECTRRAMAAVHLQPLQPVRAVFHTRGCGTLPLKLSFRCGNAPRQPLISLHLPLSLPPPHATPHKYRCSLTSQPWLKRPSQVRGTRTRPRINM